MEMDIPFGNLYSLSHYVDSSHYTPVENLDVFRREYPEHVLRFAKCVREVYADPDNAHAILKKYKVKEESFLKVTGVSSLKAKDIRLFINKYSLNQKMKIDHERRKINRNQK